MAPRRAEWVGRARREGCPLRFNQLEVFCRVYEDGSVSAAAAGLLLSQPAASMQIRDLERELGTPLFERRGRRLVPTAAGEVFYAYASQLTAVREEAEEAIAALRAGRTGRVTLGASTTGVMYHLPPFLRAFVAEAPDVRVELQCENTDRVCAWLRRRRVDVGLVWGPLREADLASETLATSAFALVLPAGHPLARASADSGEVAGAQLSTVPFIFQERHTSTRRFVEQALRAAGVQPDEAMSMRSTEEVKQAVEAGLGAALVAARAVRREVEAGVLAARRLAGCDLQRPMVLVTRPAEEDIAPAVARFLRFTRERGPALLV